MKTNIPVNTLDDAKMDQLIKNELEKAFWPGSKDTTKPQEALQPPEEPQAPQGPKKPFYGSYKAAIWFVLWVIITVVISVYAFQQKYWSIVSKMDEMTTIQEEMYWRTERVKSDLEQNKNLLDRYERIGGELTTEMANKIKNKKQKVVEVADASSK